MTRYFWALSILVGASLLAYGQDFGNSLSRLTSQQTTDFQAGRAAFLAEEGISDGLGPVFNDRACGNCHSTPNPGGGSNVVEHRFGMTRNGAFDPLISEGGSLQQVGGIGPEPGPNGAPCDYVGEVIPADATIVAERRTTPLFGLGLVDAVPDSTFLQLAEDQKKKTPAIAGTVSQVPLLDSKGNSTGTAVGKFGWKAQNPTLFQFAGDAYLNEMGITNPQFPNENCPQGDCALLVCNPVPGVNDPTGSDVAAFTDFMTLLAPPPRAPIDNDAKNGEKEFTKIGCNGCHVDTLQTGDSPIAALNHVTFHPYSDFLLHDMGNLGDGIQQNSATGRLMRTAPLWGVRVLTRFLHDGRASTLQEAIADHDGQASAARDAFQKLPAIKQEKILTFLNSL
jgi:CxxC motif-containing protein (DUF1111 family)